MSVCFCFGQYFFSAYCEWYSGILLVYLAVMAISYLNEYSLMTKCLLLMLYGLVNILLFLLSTIFGDALGSPVAVCKVRIFKINLFSGSFCLVLTSSALVESALP